ncbi:DUF6276 family protein [Natronoarchaeum mannanilyticum]|uniref:Small CPxCG-related zinc finger protein n=1 Tax=Natronoarchaeum mannanilyticum TaxID=926360 RepID=A0AAV3T985_9EURY
MRCDACGDESVVAFDVPDELREYAPDEAGVAAICPTCLDVRSASDADVQGGDAADAAASAHDAFPADPDAAAGVALLLGLLESLVLNKSEIQSLVDHLEASGTDVFLVLDRLEADPDVDPQVDLERRRPQLQQLIE